MRVDINPTLLEWAIRESGYTDHAVVEELDVDASTLSGWRQGTEQPSLTQLRAIAALMRRTPSFFFLPTPPASDTPKVAFRAAPGQAGQQLSVDTRAALRETHGMQEFLAWVTRELGLGTAHLPEIAKTTQPHVAAAQLRAALGVTIHEQLAWKSPSAALRDWRAAIEAKGISTFLVSLEGGPRGFSISNPWNPVVVVNTHAWNPAARVFTLVHELGHLLRATDSTCMTIGTSDDREEQWCDRFAAAFLMPWEQVVAYLRKRMHWNGEARIDDIDVVRRLADRFKVSVTAAAVRLVGEGVAAGSLLQRIPGASNSGRGGGSSDPEKSRLPYRRVQQYGRRTALMLQRAIDRDLVTTHEALSRLRCTFDEFAQILTHAGAQ